MTTKPGAKYPAMQVFPDIRRDVVIFFALAAVVYGAAAFFGTTYDNADQHFQTLEWADFKRTGTNEAALPWEYFRAVRPWLQPYIYVFILNAADAIGITNPFYQDRIIRFLTGALGMSSLILFGLSSAWWLPERGQRRLLVAVLALTALFPMVMTKTSSEAMSSIFIMFALSSLFLLRHGPPAIDNTAKASPPFSGKMDFSIAGLILSGISIALSFQFRYQTGPVFVVLGLWMLLVARTPIWKMLIFVAVIVFVTGLAIGIDTLGYGRFEIAALNNVKANLIDGVAASFGVEPWYYYFTEIASDPIGALLLLTLFVYWLRFPKNLLTLMTAFFLLQHMLIGHKEGRFVFPMIPLVVVMIPFVIPRAWYGPSGDRWPLLGQNIVAKGIGVAILAVNALGLYQAAFPKLKSTITVVRYIIDHHPDTFTFYSLGRTPYRAGPDTFGRYPLRFEFYSPRKVTHHIVASIDALRQAAPGKKITFIYEKNQLPLTPEWDIVRANCKQVFQSFDARHRRRYPRDAARTTLQYSIYTCRF